MARKMPLEQHLEVAEVKIGGGKQDRWMEEKTIDGWRDNGWMDTKKE